MDKIKKDSLGQWLEQILELHPQEIMLGLDRIKAVAARLGVKQPNCPLITVGGTNGKGSTVATLERIYREAGFKTGSFSSPILFRHNELVRLNGQEVSDQYFCSAYRQIEAARGEVKLTWFEFHTLAAFLIFAKESLDVWILEVGLGGRLDAVNMLDADVAVVTSIGLDHMDRLGNTREAIAWEKAGIFRKNKPVVCGDLDAPEILREVAASLNAPFYEQSKDFDFSEQAETWSWNYEASVYEHLSSSALACQNISTALMVIELLQEALPVSEEAIGKGIEKVSLPGRIELVAGSPDLIFDVAHNPHAMSFLREGLKKFPCRGKRRVLFSMLGDKDIEGSIREIKDEVDEWYVAPLMVARAASRERLEQAFLSEGINNVIIADTLEQAYKNILGNAAEEDQVLVCGSFHTVAEIKRVSG